MLFGNTKTPVKSLLINKKINRLQYYAHRERDRNRERDAMRPGTRERNKKRQNGKDYIDWA